MDKQRDIMRKKKTKQNIKLILVLKINCIPLGIYFRTNCWNFICCFDCCWWFWDRPDKHPWGNTESRHEANLIHYFSSLFPSTFPQWYSHFFHLCVSFVYVRPRILFSSTFVYTKNQHTLALYRFRKTKIK